MTSRPKDIRKSSFIATTDFQSGDYLDLVRSGQNLKIAYADFITALGVTGSLTSLGEIAAIPVLTTIGTVNYIRKIIGGAGIVAALSPSGGIQLSQNFTVDKTGVAVMVNESAASPTFRSIQAGTGISVGGSGDIIQISTSGTPGSTKTIQVFDISDFPTPSAGIITLADDTIYLLQNDVSSANRFILGANTVVSGADGSLITLGYTGTGTMFTSNDKSWKISNLTISATSGTVFSVSSSTGLHLFRFYNGNILCQDMGNFTHMYIVHFFNVNASAITNSGFTFSGDFGVVTFNTMAIIMTSSGTAFTLGSATFDSFTISRVVCNVSTSGYVLSGLASSANINTGGLGTITNLQQLGTSDVLDGNISPYDNQWEFQMNPDVPNSLDLSLNTHAGGTIAIAAVATPVLIGSTWTSIQAHRFTNSATGRWTYGGKGAHVDITVSITGHAATATHTYNFYVYKNGTQISASAVSRSFSSSDGNVNLVWNEELQTNDYLELWVENTTGTVDFVVTKATARIHS